MSGLELREVAFAYARRDVLHALNWSLAPGQVGAVVGPNGSGKSTLVALVAGWIKPTTGSVRWRGTPPGSPTPKAWAAQVAVVWQDSPGDVPFTARETAALGRLPYGDEATPEGLACVQEAMEAVDVAHLADRPLAALSGGERQRVYLARALAQQPQLLVLDEPTAYLDLAHQAQVAGLLRERTRAGVTVVWAAHDLNAVAEVADRVLLLRQDGSVEAKGPPEKVFTEETLSRVYACGVRVWPDPESGKPRIFAEIAMSDEQ